MRDIYDLYIAWCAPNNLVPASVAHFKRSWRGDWNLVLRFRKRSCHAQCEECHRLKSSITNAKSLTAHLQSAQLLVDHLRLQWLDRQVYWSMRSRARTERDVLCLISDGMDRSKFALPQWDGGRAPKLGEAANCRPDLEVVAVMAHGWRCDIYLADADVTIGSSFCMDMLLRTLDRVWQQCQRHGKPFPMDCWLQADNTPREINNSFVDRAMALLTAHGFFRCCGHAHLRVGHTHEDIDQLLGLVARILLSGKQMGKSIVGWACLTLRVSGAYDVDWGGDMCGLGVCWIARWCLPVVILPDGS